MKSIIEGSSLDPEGTTTQTGRPKGDTNVGETPLRPERQTKDTNLTDVPPERQEQLPGKEEEQNPGKVDRLPGHGERLSS